MRIKGRDVNPPARFISPNGSLQIKQLIRDVTFESLEVSPPRLLYTHNGMLCDRNSQISHFENSHEFNQLMLSVSTLDNSPPVTPSFEHSHHVAPRDIHCRLARMEARQ